MSEQELIGQEEFDQRGQHLLEIENSFLDGAYDEELFVQRIQQYKDVIALNIYNMGRALIVMKEHCGHGRFLELLEKMDISPRTAQRSMKVALKFGNPKMQKMLSDFTNKKGVASKLLELANESDDDLEILADGGTLAGLTFDEIDSMSGTEARKALRQEREKRQEDREANDRLIADKNDHADKLAEKLARLQGKPPVERWPEVVDAFKHDLMDLGGDAEKIVARIMQLIHYLPQGLTDEAPQRAEQSAAAVAVTVSNQLVNLVGELQQMVYAEYAAYLEQPSFMLSDPLAMIDDEQASS